jgi:hypothetical protein
MREDMLWLVFSESDQVAWNTNLMERLERDGER